MPTFTDMVPARETANPVKSPLFATMSTAKELETCMLNGWSNPAIWSKVPAKYRDAFERAQQSQAAKRGSRPVLMSPALERIQSQSGAVITSDRWLVGRYYESRSLRMSDGSVITVRLTPTMADWGVVGYREPTA